MIWKGLRRSQTCEMLFSGGKNQNFWDEPQDNLESSETISDVWNAIFRRKKNKNFETSLRWSRKVWDHLRRLRCRFLKHYWNSLRWTSDDLENVETNLAESVLWWKVWMILSEKSDFVSIILFFSISYIRKTLGINGHFFIFLFCLCKNPSDMLKVKALLLRK